MVCYRCNAKCSQGSRYCWKCGKNFKSKKDVYVKNVKVQKNYYKEDDGVGGGCLLLGAAIGFFLGNKWDENK